jgi:hypothetical protein
MHNLEIIKRLNQEKQDRFEGKEVKSVAFDIAKKTASRLEFFRKQALKALKENEW